MDIEIHALSFDNLHLITDEAARSVFWQVPLEDNKLQSQSADAVFDKQLWLHKVTMEWGICGYTAFVGTGQSGDNLQPAATAIFAPGNYLPGAEAMPSGPVSADAILLATAHVRDAYMGLYLEHQLIDAVVNEAKRRGVRAVEVFARDEDAIDALHCPAKTQPTRLQVSRLQREGGRSGNEPRGRVASLITGEEGADYLPEAYGGWGDPTLLHTGNVMVDSLSAAPMLTVDVVEESGFSRVGEDKLYPRYRKELGKPGSPFGPAAEDGYRDANPEWRPGTAIGGSVYGKRSSQTGIWTQQLPWSSWSRG